MQRMSPCRSDRERASNTVCLGVSYGRARNLVSSLPQILSSCKARSRRPTFLGKEGQYYVLVLRPPRASEAVLNPPTSLWSLKAGLAVDGRYAMRVEYTQIKRVTQHPWRSSSGACTFAVTSD